MTDDRRMTADRFYGGLSNRLENLRSMLGFVERETPTQDALIEWVVSNTAAGSEDAVQHHLAFLRAISLIEKRHDEYRLAKYGREFLDDYRSETLYRALMSGVKGFDTILEALREQPMTDEEIMELLVDEFEEAEMTTPGPAIRHREWLQVLGLVRRTDGTNYITDDGRELLNESIDDLVADLTDSEKVERLRERLLETEMECVPEGRHHVARDIYPHVEAAYPHLCDDSYRCDEAHENGQDQPEWQHAVRDIQQRLAERNGTRVHRQKEMGMWLFERQDGDDEGSIELPSGNTETERREVSVNRVQRNQQLVDQMKKLYDHTCQVCGQKRLLSPDEGFSHVHHLMPLGKPHDGPDVPENLVVVCPNHHEDFEHGMLTVDPQSLEIQHSYENDVDGRTLETREDHEPGAQYLAYHNEVIATN